MSEHEDQRQQAVSDLANALQVASPLSTRLRRVLGELVQETVNLEAAVERAAHAVKRLQPPATGRS